MQNSVSALKSYNHKGRGNPPDHILAVEDLAVSKIINSTRKEVLKGISFNIKEGEILDVVGPSGCGKSTLLAAIAYMIPKDSGMIYLDGEQQETYNPISWRKDISLLMQKSVVLKASVRENLLLPWTLKLRKNLMQPPDDELRKYLDKIKLQNVSLKRDATELSGGEQSRISLLRSLMTKPRILLLDEPEASLDKETAGITLNILLEYLSENRTAIIRVQHHHWDEKASRSILIHEGRIVEENSA